MHVPTHSTLSSVSEHVYDDALNTVITHMHKDRSCLWNSVELHELYVKFGGDQSRKAMLLNLTNCLGNDWVLIRVDGCTSIIGYRETVGSTLQMVKEDDNDNIYDLVRQVRTEARALKHNSANYDLSTFTKAKESGKSESGHPEPRDFNQKPDHVGACHQVAPSSWQLQSYKTST